MLFSATMPKLMAELAQNYLRDPIRVEAAPPGKPADKVRQGLIFVEQSAKAELLIEKLDGHRNELALVFARTKHGAEKLMKTLDRAGFAAGSIHGNKSQGQRDRALAAFKAGELRVLVATDVAARGLDIPDVRHVYNYDLPNVPDNYVHRIGRTARAGRDGSAVTFCSAAEMSELRAIEKVMGRPIPVLEGTSWEPERTAHAGRTGRPGPSGKPARSAHPARSAGHGAPQGEGQKPARRRRARSRGRVRQAA
jgi:ATP-dependent RNA helicase RhlE